MTHTDSTTHPGIPLRGRLWFALWGGGVAWLLHLLIAYVLGEFGCLSCFGKSMVLGVSILAWLLLLVSFMMLSGAAFSGWLGWHAWNYLKTQGPAEENSELALARTASVANALFFLIILAQTIPIFFFLKEC